MAGDATTGQLRARARSMTQAARRGYPLPGYCLPRNLGEGCRRPSPWGRSARLASAAWSAISQLVLESEMDAAAGRTDLSASTSEAGRCRHCGTPLRYSLVDLGMSPLCESFLTKDQLGDPEVLLPAPRQGLRFLLAGSAASVRQPGPHLQRICLLLLVLDELGRACGALLRHDQEPPRTWARQLRRRARQQ